MKNFIINGNLKYVLVSKKRTEDFLKFSYEQLKTYLPKLHQMDINDFKDSFLFGHILVIHYEKIIRRKFRYTDNLNIFWLFGKLLAGAKIDMRDLIFSVDRSMAVMLKIKKFKKKYNWKNIGDDFFYYHDIINKTIDIPKNYLEYFSDLKKFTFHILYCQMTNYTE